MPKKTCKLIKKTKNHYLIALKGNQKNLLNEVKFNFTCDEAVVDIYDSIEKNRGRIEYRKVTVTQYLDGINTKGWVGLKSIIMVNRERTIDNKKTEETQYFISDLTKSAKIFYEGIRGHWSIENSLHYVKDVSFKEDASKIKKGNAPEIMAIMRGGLINLIRQSGAKNIKKKIRECMWQFKIALSIIRE